MKERTLELEKVNDKLSASNEELERFTYIASHDLKEPLRNITSFINLIQRKLGDSANAELEEYMGYVTRNARQMYHLIEDVLNFSWLSTTDLSGVKLIALNVVVFEVEASINTLIHEKKGQLLVDELPAIKGHKTYLFMLLKNLIENGLKYNESEAPAVHIGYQEEKDHFRFTIKDNGIGIDPEYQEQIFEMFRRMSPRAKYEGTGIGLATCKKIVNKYGGQIWGVKNAREALFYFTWPK